MNSVVVARTYQRAYEMLAHRILEMCGVWIADDPAPYNVALKPARAGVSSLVAWPKGESINPFSDTLFIAIFGENMMPGAPEDAVALARPVQVPPAPAAQAGSPTWIH